MIKTLDDILELSKNDGKRVRVAVAAAQDEAALTAMIDAIGFGIARGILFGDAVQIEQSLQQHHFAAFKYIEIHGCEDDIEAAEKSVASIRSGKADLLLKGKLKTATLLKAVLHEEKGLRSGRLLSDVFLFENPLRAVNKLMMITDGGVTLKPDLKQKIEIIENAVTVAHALGNPNPHVALLSAVETVNKKIPSTLDAAIITTMNKRGQIAGCTIDGPFALDNALSDEAAKIKGIDSPVAGKADILVCPEIESANLLAKATTYFGNFRLAHVIIGSTAPVMIPSRADTADAKLLSIALGKLIYLSLDYPMKDEELFNLY
jgi:phosphate butyryltransferase